MKHILVNFYKTYFDKFLTNSKYGVTIHLSTKKSLMTDGNSGVHHKGVSGLLQPTVWAVFDFHQILSFLLPFTVD